MCPGFLRTSPVSSSYITHKSITHFNGDQKGRIRSKEKEVIANVHTKNSMLNIQIYTIF